MSSDFHDVRTHMVDTPEEVPDPKSLELTMWQDHTAQITMFHTLQHEEDEEPSRIMYMAKLPTSDAIDRVFVYLQALTPEIFSRGT